MPSLPSTLTIPVGYGYAFDFLSIYEVKMARNHQDYRAALNYELTVNHLAGQIGQQLLDTVLASEEYDRLFRTNDKVFGLVDLAKANAVTAKEVDAANYERFLAKQAIQTRFFAEATQIEQKFGYTS